MDDALLPKDHLEARDKRRLYWKDVALVVLTTAVLLLTVLAFSTQHSVERAGSQYAGIKPSTDRWVQFHWLSKYSRGASEADIDRVWEAIVPAHGIVALENAWAADKKLPATMKLPGDHSKGVYIIDAYHQLHCLKIVRKTFFELAAGKLPTFPPAHATHCFDSLRQYVMCTAGDTPLYTWGKNETGDGQLRKCRDWTALSSWAAENSACYQDTENPVPLGDHFGHCESHGDGLEPLF